MGSSLDALMAGSIPNRIPTVAEKPTPMTNDQIGSATGGVQQHQFIELLRDLEHLKELRRVKRFAVDVGVNL